MIMIMIVIMMIDDYDYDCDHDDDGYDYDCDHDDGWKDRQTGIYMTHHKLPQIDKFESSSSSSSTFHFSFIMVNGLISASLCLYLSLYISVCF